MNNRLNDARQTSYSDWSESAAQELADLFDAVSRLDDSLNTGAMAYRGESCGDGFQQARNSSLLAKKALAACKRQLADAMRTMS